ncbi:hypothetical protein ABR738_24050 [Streptomyces sp. Edi4]|uniref:hypothetical protein n=1 Tax=Streptomyces sp. Edi4 TaxID=3162527 RepID=UPI003305905F
MPTATRLTMAPTAFSAVRALRCELRAAHVFAVSARESRRAIDWADAGYVAAAAPLCRGRGIGFTLPLRTGEIAEWHIRPLPCLQLTAPEWCEGAGSPPAPCLVPEGQVTPSARPSTAR